MDDLEALFRQCEEQEAAFEQEYADLYRGQMVSSAPQPTVAKRRPKDSVTRVQKKQEHKAPKSKVLSEEEDMQMYMLRRRYTPIGTLDEMERQLRVPIEPQSAFRDCALVQYEESELYLLIQTLLQKGKVTEELMQALQFQYQRKDSEEYFLKLFFMAWTSIQQEVSKQKMKQLMECLPTQGSSTKEWALAAIRDLLVYALDVIEEAERLKEQGFRNRQEALEQALHMAESRYQAARRDVQNHRY